MSSPSEQPYREVVSSMTDCSGTLSELQSKGLAQSLRKKSTQCQKELVLRIGT